MANSDRLVNKVLIIKLLPKNYILVLKRMFERKVWTEEEDRVLKFLKEVRGIVRWSAISQAMEKQFNIHGRNGKQCRERYHNHLDKGISNSEWTLQQENKLFQIQDEVGNKWALISSKLPGRTDNCVKNHFYSKLRKGLRKLNRKVNKHFKREFKEITTATLYKIIQTIENKAKNQLSPELDSYELCKKIKHQIKDFESLIQTYEKEQQELDYVRHILEDIALLEPEIKKNVKKNALKSSKKLEDQESSKTPHSKKVSSTKSVYDEQQSQHSNSELFSSSSFGQHSFPSNRSQGLLTPQKINRESIQSQSEDEENFSQKIILYKSANSLTTLKQASNSGVKLFESLKLPIAAQPKLQNDKQSVSSEKSNKSGGNQTQKIFEFCPPKLDMIGEQQPFATQIKMRLFSPKKPSHDEIMEMNEERDELFYGQKMEIDCEHLIEKISVLGIHDMPILEHSSNI